jgi:hypothetical protein
MCLPFQHQFQRPLLMVSLRQEEMGSLQRSFDEEIGDSGFRKPQRQHPPWAASPAQALAHVLPPIGAVIGIAAPDKHRP